MAPPNVSGKAPTVPPPTDKMDNFEAQDTLGLHTGKCRKYGGSGVALGSGFQNVPLNAKLDNVEVYDTRHFRSEGACNEGAAVALMLSSDKLSSTEPNAFTKGMFEAALNAGTSDAHWTTVLKSNTQLRKTANTLDKLFTSGYDNVDEAVKASVNGWEKRNDWQRYALIQLLGNSAATGKLDKNVNAEIRTFLSDVAANEKNPQLKALAKSKLDKLPKPPVKA